ncbi:MAG: hypothetical protein ACP5IE_06450 [Infirmifilum sp.]|uniref:hypothetical protein n=2 Tax=Infirmifilum TaxID=2856573 RepID=UPI00069BAAA3
MVEKMGYIPKALLRRLYVKGSMKVSDGVLSFKLRNNLATAQVDSPIKVQVDGKVVEKQSVEILLNGKPVTSDPTPQAPLEVPVGSELEVRVRGPYEKGRHKVSVEVSIKGYGVGAIEFEDEAQ